MSRPTLPLALLPVLFLSAVGFAEDKVPVERTFADAATLHGDTYALTRDFLAGQGADLLPFLATRRESEDWRERRLARVLTLLIEDPEGAAATRSKLAGGAKTGAIPPEHEPLVTDYLWQRLPDVRSSPGPSRAVVRAIETAGHLGNLETARALLHLGTCSQIAEGRLLDALARIGDAALPALREAVDSGDDRADAAIEVLARLRDPGSAPCLIRSLGREDRGRRLIAVASALAAIGVPAGLPPILNAMERLVRTHRRHSSGYDHTYRRLRLSAMALAPGAGEVLEEAARDKSLLESALARGIRFEAREPDRAREFYTLLGEVSEAVIRRQWPGRAEHRPPEERGRESFWRRFGDEPEHDAVEIPEALLLERAVAYGRIGDLRRVTLLENDDPGFGILAEALLERDRFRRKPELMRLLAGRHGVRALGPMRKLLEEPFTYYLADLIRETLFIGSEEAVPLLDEILLRAEAKNTNATRYRPHAGLAKAIRSALTGPPDVLAELLRHEDPGVREASALALGRRGDPRAVAPLLRAAAAREGPRHVEAVTVLTSFGDAALDTVEPCLTDPDPRVALLAEVLVLFITRPEVVSGFPDPPERPAWFGRGARVPMLPRFRAHARVVADALGEEGVPLLEAEVAFSGDPRRIIHAALALAMIGRERSIEVLVRAGPGPWVDGKSLLAQALLEFGEKGIEAAKRIPAPDPGRPGFSSRAGRHESAAEALAHEKTPEGLEKIIEGLTGDRPEARYGQPDPIWTFLNLAGHYHHPRLLDALLDLQRRKPRSYRSTIATLLGGYPDPRVAPVLVEMIEQSNDRELETAALALERHAGSRASELLLGRLKVKLAPRRRARVVEALGRLGSRERREPLVALAYDQAVAPLLEVMEERSRASRAAAEALTAMTWSRRGGILDRRAVEPLARWFAGWKGSRISFGWSFFIEPRDDDALRVLLAAYLSSDRGNHQLAAILGAQGFTEVIPDLVRHRELDVLARLGQPGLDALHGLYLEEKRAGMRSRTLELLREKKHRIPFEDVTELLDPLIANGPWDPRFARLERIDRELTALVRAGAAMAAWLDPKRAHPLLKAGAIASPDRSVREILAKQAAGVEKAHPDLADTPARVAGIRPGGEGPVARVDLLEAFDRFRPAATPWRQLSELDLDALADIDAAGLRALVELCYPPGPTPSPEEVRRAVALLDDPKRADEAIPLLALTFYPAELLPSDSAATRAIRDWRRDGPWFHIEWRKFHTAATAIARSRLSLELMRDFTRQNLDRLARIRGPVERHPENTLLAHLLMSIRMSPDPEEREILAEFPARAEDRAGAVAVRIMAIGVRDDLPRWKDPPEHDYTESYLAAIDPARPATLRMAMRALKKDKRLRPRLMEVLAAEATAEDLRHDVAEHLWRTFGDSAARDYFVPRLLSPERKVFRNAIRILTSRKAAGGSVCPHLTEVLARGEEWRKIEVIRSLRGFYYSGRSVRAAGVTAAPFLVSEAEEVRKAARKVLLWLQESGWFDMLGHLVKKHEDADVRREAAVLREQFAREKAAKERERER